MPARQEGQPYRTGNGWGLRYYDEDGQRRRQSGFSSRSEARAWFREAGEAGKGRQRGRQGGQARRESLFESDLH